MHTTLGTHLPQDVLTSIKNSAIAVIKRDAVIQVET